jgi:hypothetical protein
MVLYQGKKKKSKDGDGEKAVKRKALREKEGDKKMSLKERHEAAAKQAKKMRLAKAKALREKATKGENDSLGKSSEATPSAAQGEKDNLGKTTESAKEEEEVQKIIAAAKEEATRAVGKLADESEKLRESEKQMNSSGSSGFLRKSSQGILNHS